MKASAAPFFCWFEWVDFYGVCVEFRADPCVCPIAFTLKKDLDVLEKHQGLFASFSTGCLFLNVHVGIGLHVYTYRSAHTYA